MRDEVVTLKVLARVELLLALPAAKQLLQLIVCLHRSEAGRRRRRFGRLLRGRGGLLGGIGFFRSSDDVAHLVSTELLGRGELPVANVALDRLLALQIENTWTTLQYMTVQNRKKLNSDATRDKI